MKTTKQNKENKTNWLKRILALLMLCVGTPLFIVYWSLYDKLTTNPRFKKEIKPFLQIKKRSILFFGNTLMICLGLLSGLYSANFLRVLIGYLSGTTLSLQSTEQVAVSPWPILFQALDLKNLFDFYLLSQAPLLVIPLTALFSGCFIAFYSRFYKKHRDFNGNEKGDDRLLTPRELRKTYTKIPNRGLRFRGYGGIPISHELASVIGGGKKLINLSVIALKAKMLCHFPRLDTKNKSESNTDEFVDENSNLGIKALGKIGKWITESERILNLVTGKSGSYYIIPEAVNSIIVGMTRSGKGETEVTPIIDILSRAEKQSSMVIGDPKGELYQMSYDTLIKRNYNVQVLNFQNVDFSMSYNPLWRAIDFAKKGYYEDVQTAVDTVAEAFYRNAKSTGDGNAKFWEDSSVNLFSALIMGIIWRAKEANEWETVTLRSMVSMLNQLGSEEVLVDAEGNELTQEDLMEGVQGFKRSKITLYFDELKKINREQPSQFLTMADDSFRQSNFAGEETKGSIFSSMISGVKNFLNDSIARMTSENQLDMTTVGFPRQLAIKFRSSTDQSVDNPYLNQVAKLSIFYTSGKPLIKETKVIIDSAGYLTYLNVPFLPETSIFKVQLDEFDEHLTFKVEKKNDRIKAVEIDRSESQKVSGKGLRKKVSKVKQTTDGLAIENDDITVKYSEKPTAIFLVIPPNRKSFNGMVSLFVDQMFNTTFDLAQNADGRTAVNRISYVLDEFGNLPAIPNMGTNLSIGLSTNQEFYLFVQNNEQIIKIYGVEEAETIFGNCTVNMYIKSVSDKTMEKFEKASGDKTVTVRHKNENEHGGVSISSNTDKQAVLSQGQLRKLQAGEAFISIGVKAETKAGQKTTNHPILAAGRFEFPYRYMFLVNEFDQSKTLADIPIKSKHRHLKLIDIAVDWSLNYEGLKDYRSNLKNPRRPANGGIEKLKQGRIKPPQAA